MNAFGDDQPRSTTQAVAAALHVQEDTGPGKKKKPANRKDQKEVRQSISRARDEHRRNLQEISKINESVKYSPRVSLDRDNLHQRSVDVDDSGP